MAYTPLANVTVPFTPHVKTYLYGVPGYDRERPDHRGRERQPRLMAWQFWVGYVPEEGYVAVNTGQTHIDFWAFTADFAVPTVTGYGARRRRGLR